MSFVSHKYQINPSLLYLKNILRAGLPLVGFHEDLVLKHGISLNCGFDSFRKYHLFLKRWQNSIFP